MSFEKSKEYIENVYNFMEVLYKKALTSKDYKLTQICKLIFKYLITCCSENKILIRDLKKNENFDMKHVYDYISENKIEILDLNNILPDDIDINNPLDIERFVLSHIYYIYANNK
jgi:hypothetical protein